MSKINTITLSNFKFFGKEETIELGGKHLLLYGENGSGKSSIYWALYTLLEASSKNPNEVSKYFKPLSVSPDSLVNIHAVKMSDIATHTEHFDSVIRIVDTNGVEHNLSLIDTTICGDSSSIESRKASDFIDYKSLFKFQNFRNSESSELNSIFIESILPFISFGSFLIRGHNVSNAFDMWTEVIKGPELISDSRGRLHKAKAGTRERASFVTLRDGFNIGFERMISFINLHASEFLKQLGYDFVFHLSYKKADLRKKDKRFSVSLSITKYEGEKLALPPHKLLNEAKMSAVAIAIRLAIIKYRINSAAENALKVLMLDDIMISLDMSNRDKLLNLILREFSEDNKGFQVFLFTHDKRLYEYIGYKIKQENQKDLWNTYEMYAGTDYSNKRETPIIINSECGYIEKAQKFFDVTKDYSSCAVNLRKALEMEVGKRLPIELKKRADGGFVDLQTLWKKLKSYYSNNNCVGSKDIKNIDRLFNESKLFVLNPSAHYQSLSIPIYKSELEKAFLLYSKVAALPTVHRELKIAKDSYVLCSIPAKKYICGFYLDDDLVVVEGEHIISRMPKCYKIFWEYNGIEYYNFVTGVKDLTNPLIKSTPKLDSFISRLPLGIDEQTFLSNCRINGIPINDYLGGVKISSLIVQSAKP